MDTVYRLVGYDRTSEFLEERHDIPQSKAVAAKRAAGIALANDELMGDWPLSDAQARAIAALINSSIDLDDREYFLEPYSVVDDVPHRPGNVHAA